MSLQDKVVYSSYLANGIFNALLCLTAIHFNSITIHAIRRTASLPKPLKTLLLGLAVSDLCTGLFAHPFYVARMVKFVNERTTVRDKSAPVNVAFSRITNFLFFASFLSVLVLTVDRFLAIHFHLRYQQVVTYKRSFVVVISLFMVSASLSSVSFWFKHAFTIQTVFEIVCLTITLLLYCRIYSIVRRHRSQMHAQQVRHEAAENREEKVNAERGFKLARSTFYVYLIFVICYSPQMCINVISINSGGRKQTADDIFPYFWTLALLNSSLNPLIYCWRIRHIRCTVKDILRKMFHCRN